MKDIQKLLGDAIAALSAVDIELKSGCQMRRDARLKVTAVLRAAKQSSIQPCGCSEYNGGQYYNCLNGAYDLCRSCEQPRANIVGLIIVCK